MQTIGTRELRSELAAHVRRAGAGAHLTITVGGRPTAVLGPVERADVGVTLEALAAAGLIVPRRRLDDPAPPAPVAVWSGARLDLALREVRG